MERPACFEFTRRHAAEGVEIPAASMGDAAGPGEFLFTMTNSNADRQAPLRSTIRDEFRITSKTAINPGGARRDRTDDLMLAKHALSQLSYGPGG
jgi:hypothetical protein